MNDSKSLEESLVKIFGRARVIKNKPLSYHTTFRLGGPADLFLETKTTQEVQAAVKACGQAGSPYFVLGVGANLLVGDQGFRGLVIRPLLNQMEVVGSLTTGKGIQPEQRHYQSYDEDHYLKFDDLDLVEPPADTLVRVGAGAVVPQLIIWSLEQGLTGLQNFAGIPASVGGAVYNNIHGGTHLFDEFIEAVVLVNQQGKIEQVAHEKMEFAYDKSRLQRTHEVVLEVLLRLSHGDIEKARRVRLEWLKRKLKVQPQKDCPGCIFKNVSPETAKRIGAPTVATAWVIDQGLGLKGAQIGGVKISEKHANFFVNTGAAKAADVLALISLVKTKAKEKFGLNLVEEIQMIGDF